MGESVIDHFPIPLAIRVLLDSVSYTNAVPEWFEPLTIDYTAREATIRRLIGGYLRNAQPQKPFKIVVPKRDGQSNTWIVPSINDQIICQSCVTVVAASIQSKAIDRTKVFSCRLNTEPNYLLFLEDQVSAWASFQARALAMCADKTCVLQIDLKNAFDSIPLSKMGAFIDRLGVD
jgi:hypothetical protein